MPFIILTTLSIVATWRWGDWRNWQRYHSTILYFLLGNLFYCYSTFHYPLWVNHPLPPFQSYIVTDVITMFYFAIMLLIYLSHYPRRLWRQVVWVGLWIAIYCCIEGMLYLTDGIRYYHGWTLFHSTLFNLLMFPMLRLHFKRPLIAYIMSIPITIALFLLMRVPLR